MTWAEAPQRVTTSCVHTVGFDQVVIAIALRFLLMPRILAVVIAAILSIGAASAQDAAPLTLDEAINAARGMSRSEEHTSELQSLMRISYAVFCLKKKKIRYEDSTNTILSKMNTEMLHPLS